MFYEWLEFLKFMSTTMQKFHGDELMLKKKIYYTRTPFSQINSTYKYIKPGQLSFLAFFFLLESFNIAHNLPKFKGMDIFLDF